MNEYIRHPGGRTGERVLLLVERCVLEDLRVRQNFDPVLVSMLQDTELSLRKRSPAVNSEGRWRPPAVYTSGSLQVLSCPVLLRLVSANNCKLGYYGLADPVQCRTPLMGNLGSRVPVELPGTVRSMSMSDCYPCPILLPPFSIFLSQLVSVSWGCCEK